MINKEIFIFFLIGIFGLLIGIVMSQTEINRDKIEKLMIERKNTSTTEIIKLRKQIKVLKKDLIDYEYKVNDLAIAFINHHGNFPRTIR